MSEKHKNKSIIILTSLVSIIILVSVLLFVIDAGDEKKQECESYSAEECPESCTVCPPCAACSSISCRSDDFCKSIGFDKSWYEKIK